jgi:hypothetical protein
LTILLFVSAENTDKLIGTIDALGLTF